MHVICNTIIAVDLCVQLRWLSAL